MLSWLRSAGIKLNRFINKSEPNSSYENFLATLIEIVADSDNDQEKIHSLLRKNLDKLDDHFAWLLQNLEINTPNVDSASSQDVAAAITCFSFQLQQFSSGSKDSNLEISIIGYQKALEVFTRNDFPNQWADIYNNLSVAFWERVRGDRAENLEFAIICCENALLVYTREVAPEAWALAQSNLANAYSQRIQGKRAENLETAIICCKNALQVYNPKFNTADWSRTQINLANAYLYRIQGERAENIEKAISHYNYSLQVITSKSFPEQWALIYHNLVGAYVERNFGDRAENIELAILCGKKALKAYKDLAFLERWATVQNELAVAYSKRLVGNRTKNLYTAIKLFKRALKILNRDAFPQRYVGTLTNLGFNYQALGKDLTAYDAFASAIDTLESLRLDINSGDEAKQKLAEEYNRLYQSMVEVCISLACDNPLYGKKAVEYVERSKTRNLVELLTDQERYPKGASPGICEHLDQLRHDIRIEQRRLAVEERRSSMIGRSNVDEGSAHIDALFPPKIPSRDYLTELQQQLDQLIKNKIHSLDPGFSFTRKSQPISFREILELLPDKQTSLIEWYILDEVFVAFVITAQGNLYIWVSDPSDLQSLLDWKTEYLSSYKHQKSEWQANLLNQLKKLSEILHLDEILNYIPVECNRLILVPHRFLHLLPLHALVLVNCDISSGRFEKGISYTPSCQLLQLTKNREKSFSFQSLWAIQDPTEDLNYADLEVSTIQAAFPITQVLAKQEATKTALTTHQALIQADCVHFACHGIFNLESPLESALILAQEQGDGSSPINRLLLSEIFDLDLRRCGLVTLSACETGLIDSTALSDEYVGLPSGFLYAGTSRLVSSLWTVSDVSTAILMGRFYENLRSQMPVSLALNQAQCWLRDITGEELSQWIKEKQLPLSATLKLSLRRRFSQEQKPFLAPYYWAAFCAIGQP